MSNFEEYMSYIANGVGIDPCDRRTFTRDFDMIRDYILFLMKKDEVFDCLFDGPSLFGSWMDNVKNHYPDEFDVHIKLKLPHMGLIQIEPDPYHPGFINLNLEKLLKKLYHLPQYDDIYELFYDFVGDNYHLRRSKVNNWFEELIESGFENYGNRHCNYVMNYSKRGTAHSIFAEHLYSGKKFKIDFVAAFVFPKAKWMASRPFPYGVKTRLWFAVPKPCGGPRETKCYTFSICAPQVERDLILNKMNLKHSLRLLKALNIREQCMPRLKSYFIKTVFLWECEEVDDSFWSQPIGEVFVHMLGRLVDYFEDKDLPCYWDEDQNLLDRLSDEEIEDYEDNLRDVYNKFITYDYQKQLSFGRVASFFTFKSPEYKKLDFWKI